MNILLIYLIIVALLLIFHIWLIIDIFSSRMSASSKGLWFLAVLFIPLASIVYLFIRDSTKKRMKRVRSYKKKSRRKR